MSKSVIFIFTTVVTLFIASCAPLVAPSTPIVTEEPGIPVTGIAVVQSVEIQILESEPIQVNAVLRGQLPDAGCTTIASVDQVRNGNTFQLTVRTTTDPLALCTQVLTPFEQVVNLDVKDLPAGRYTVQVSGIEQSFELAVRDAAQFQQMLLEALNARDYARLQAFMAQSFMIGYWLSEGTSNTPEHAIEQLQRNLLASDHPIVADPNKDLVALLGTDPVRIVGPEVTEASPLFTTGWGAEGKDEAILFTAKRPSGELYWYGLLFAKDGFAPSGPVIEPVPTNPPQSHEPDPEEIPTITVVAVTQDESVTIRAYNFPADTKFSVWMGEIGTQGIDGILVETINSRKGGSFVTTFEIPEKLHGEKQIAIRLQSQSGYYSYNWFHNKTSALAVTEVLPTDVEYVMARQHISIHNGPAKKYRIIGGIAEGEIARVTGVSVDGKWWRVLCPDASVGNCWVFAKPAYTRPADLLGY